MPKLASHCWHGKKTLEDKEPIMGSSSKAISGNRYERLRSLPVVGFLHKNNQVVNSDLINNLKNMEGQPTNEDIIPTEKHDAQKSAEWIDVEISIDQLKNKIKGLESNSEGRNELREAEEALNERAWKDISRNFGVLADKIISNKELAKELGWGNFTPDEVTNWLLSKKMSSSDIFGMTPSDAIAKHIISEKIKEGKNKSASLKEGDFDYFAWERSVVGAGGSSPLVYKIYELASQSKLYSDNWHHDRKDYWDLELFNSIRCR